MIWYKLDNRLTGILKMSTRGILTTRHFRLLAFFCLVHVLASLCFLTFLVPTRDPNTMSPQTDFQRGVADKWVPTIHSMKNTTTGLSRREDAFSCDLSRILQLNSEVCERLIRNTSHEGETLLYQSRRKPLSRDQRDDIRQADQSCNIATINADCKEVRQSYLYGKDALTADEISFPLAFAIKLHSNSNQAHRLLRYIYRKHNVYCIHVDKKASDLIHEQFLNISKCLDNIIVIEDRVSLVYSTIRQVEAEFRCMDAIFKSNITWRYYINLTGKEFMLKTNAEIVKILKLLNGRNDIESYPMLYDSHKYKQRTFIVGKRAYISKLEKEPFDRDITIRKGSAYGLMSRKFLQFVQTDVLAQEFIGWLKDAYAPEEIIWATLNALENAPGGSKKDITQKNKMFLSRAVIWSLDKQYSCKGKFVRWVCIYGTGDLPWLLSHKNIVANKFEEDYQPLALDCLERSMYWRLLTNNGTDVNFDLERYTDMINL